MKSEQEIKELLKTLNNQGSKSPQAEKILFAKIDTLNWVLGLTTKKP